MRCGLPRGGCAGLLGALADRHEGFSPAFGGVPQGRGCPKFVGRGPGLQDLPRRILLTELLGVSTISHFLTLRGVWKWGRGSITVPLTST